LFGTASKRQNLWLIHGGDPNYFHPPGVVHLPSTLPWQDWFLGESDDPLNVPFALFIYRYSTPGEAVVVGEMGLPE